MKALPTPPSPGKPVSATLIRKIIDAIRERTVIGGRGTRVSFGPNGTTIEVEYKAPARPSPSSLPWTFRCTEDPDTGERTGGWRECILQLGYHKFLFSGDLSEGTPRGDGSGVIAGTDLTDDGDYIVEVDTKNETAEIKLVEGNLQDDIPNSIVRIWIGEVRDGKQVSGIHHHPVVYKYI